MWKIVFSGKKPHASEDLAQASKQTHLHTHNSEENSAEQGVRKLQDLQPKYPFLCTAWLWRINIREALLTLSLINAALLVRGFIPGFVSGSNYVEMGGG